MMFSVIKGLFGNSTVVEAGVNMLDGAFFTDQEKSAANQKILDWKLKYFAATAPMNVARRLIAVVVTGMWALMVLMGVALHLSGAEDAAIYVFDVLKEIVMQPFSIIMGFYFLAHVVRANKG